MGYYNNFILWISRGLNGIARAAPIYQRLKGNYINLADSVDRKERVIGQLERDIRELNGVNGARIREVQEYEQRVSSLTASLEESRTKLIGLGSQVASLTQDNVGLNRKYDEEMRRYGELERAYNVQVAGAGHHKEEIKRLKKACLKQGVTTYLAAHPSDFVVAVDADDIITTISKRALRKLGFKDEEESLGRNVYSLIVDDKIKTYLKRRVGAHLAGGKEGILREVLPDLVMRNPDNGIECKANVVVIPQKSEPLIGRSNKNLDYYIGSIIVEESRKETRLRVREERKKAEEKKRAEQINEAVEEVSFRTKVNGIKKAVKDFLIGREINPDEPESPPENKAAPEQI